ncbi:hypothetical protein DRF65_11620 [Chryseobacterium pennae]|uniref:Type I restriction modification DNA specificity domain-containing protein n=1 Tax=Chryseobacterium pennae TaxID=2258962 RepID=A0A3D9C905_9FLAO|nr:restriction endonuclease subunit S [Chryseobacterium pennae]REC62353.1 hypothetical protein DRF65_11620 [Chryseobacterium pennae]
MEIKEYKLGELCSLQIGYPFQSEHFVKEGIPVIRPADIGDKIKNPHETLKSNDLKRFERFTVEKGDVLISMSGVSLGKTFVYSFDEKGFFNQYVACFKFGNTKLLLNEYLYILLQGIQKDIVRHFSGTSPTPLITKVFIENYPVKIPSIKDQVKIVDIYDRALKVGHRRSKSIQLCDLLSQSLFLETQKQAKKHYSFNKIIEIQTNLKKSDIIDSADLPFITPNNITPISGDIIKSDQSHHSKSVNSKFYFTEEHILFSRKISDLNRIATPNFKGFCNTNIYPFLVEKTTANKHYIRYILLSHDFFNFTMNFLGSKQVASLNRSVIYNYTVKLPSKKIQDQFSKRVQNIEKLRSYFEQNLVSIQAIESMIIHKTRMGELYFNSDDFDNVIPEEIQPEEDPAITKINENIADYHRNLPHTGAPPEIDNMIRQLDTELRLKGDIPFTEDYVKYRIVRGKFKDSFTFRELWNELTTFPFETIPSYDEICNLVFKWLKEELPFVRQQFNDKTKQIEIIINETT